MDATESLHISCAKLHAKGELEKQNREPDHHQTDQVGNEEHATCKRKGAPKSISVLNFEWHAGTSLGSGYAEGRRRACICLADMCLVRSLDGGAVLGKVLGNNEKYRRLMLRHQRQYTRRITVQSRVGAADIDPEARVVDQEVKQEASIKSPFNHI